MDNPEKLRLLSLCTGYGGIERGLELAGLKFRTVAHVEIEAYAIANLVKEMENGKMGPAPIWTNLKTLPLGAFPKGTIDIITGGYPCQPFSTAGKRLGEEDPRHLWPYILDIIDSIMPKMCFFENVEGHISQGLQAVRSDLESRGYKVKIGIFSAEEVGAPHRRKRIFILAKLGNSESHDERRSPIPSVHGKGVKAGRSSCDELADSDSIRRDRREVSHRNDKRCISKQTRQQKGQPMVRSEVEGCGRDSRGNELADSASSGQPESKTTEEERALEIGERGPKGRNENREPQIRSEGHCRWPSRPGEQQYEWEEPRVLADTNGRECESRVPTKQREDAAEKGARMDDRLTGQSHGGQTAQSKTKPGVGGAINGTENRIDRLRLLGNGVVPQAAALAFILLNEAMYKEPDQLEFDF